uniref:AMP-binding enzyme C-terminal domain-containing protein n=1 Tax=Plectus sambesii TaxID=2011161 RepID=A0A914W8M1_9BILA
MRRLTGIKQVTVGVFLTEAGCMPVMSQADAPPESLLRTQGQIADHFEVKLLGFDGALAPRGQMGEICVRPIANSEFLGYYKENELSRSFFVHGWILTGDIGVMDEAGNVQVLGQKQDVIFPTSDGTKVDAILPWIIERKLATHPDLIGVQVVGVPGASGKTQTCAIVVLKSAEGHTADHARVKADLTEMCQQEKLVAPNYIVFVKDFPRTQTKKVQKFKLREMVLALIKEQSSA